MIIIVFVLQFIKAVILTVIHLQRLAILCRTCHAKKYTKLFMTGGYLMGSGMWSSLLFNKM